ncbi:MAG TPA: GyrI-like domain-containing protein [Acidimicrobiia bacterium]|jgi:hypothetical protein
MNALEDRQKLEELYLPPADRFVTVDVPDLQFVMVDGEGDPSGEPFATSSRWLWTVAHPLKRIARERMGKNYAEAPLECLWWADDIGDFIAGRREKLKWRQMIVTADWVDEGMFEESLVPASERLGDAPETLRLERFDEGRCVQIMHIGHNRDEVATLRRLHNEYLPSQGLMPRGHHHEIYLTDPNRVAPEKWRTVLRQPVIPGSFEGEEI